MCKLKAGDPKHSAPPGTQAPKERSRNSDGFANILNQHLFAIYQA